MFPCLLVTDSCERQHLAIYKESNVSQFQHLIIQKTTGSIFIFACEIYYKKK